MVAQGSKNKPLNMPSSNTLITSKRHIGPDKSEINNYGYYPSFRRPNTNGVNHFNNEHEYTAPFGKARPMKQWRKQLDSTIKYKQDGVEVNYPSANGKSWVNYNNWMPGGITNSKVNYCNLDQKTQYQINEFFKVNKMYSNQNAIVQNNGFVQVGDPDDPDSYRIQTGVYNTKCIAGNPEANIIKPASTVMSKAYYSDTKGYLQSRCKTYDQKNSHYSVDGHKTENNQYPMTNCPKTKTTAGCLEGNYNDCCKVTTVYKPNNSSFQTQGAVSSSLRTLQKDVNTINKNGASFKSSYGLQAANAGKYSSNSNGPYFVKSKQSKPICKRIIGNRTICF